MTVSAATMQVPGAALHAINVCEDPTPVPAVTVTKLNPAET